MATSDRDIYLDANATTRVLPEAACAAMDAMSDLFGNPSSSHIAGLRARSILGRARKLALRALGAETGRVVFTSGATEAIQTAVFSALCACRGKAHNPNFPRRVFLYGATEHKAVPQALQHWSTILGLPHVILPIPVDSRGQLDMEFLARHSRADLVCTMAVNNETGVVHDLRRVEEVLRNANAEALWLVDAVQAVAKADLNLSRTTIDYVAVSGHKLYAPKGIGLLYVREGAPLTALMAGGGQESGARSGTENLPGVAAIAAVFDAMESKKFRDRESLGVFRDRLVASLQRAFPNIVFNTPFEIAVPTTVNFSVPGMTGKELLDLFDAADIRLSSGSACGSALTGSYVLEAMGLPAWRSEGAIRLSFGPAATPQEIGTACMRIAEVGEALRSSCLVVREEHEPPAAPRHGLMQLKRGSMCSWLYLDSNSRNTIIVDPFAELAERIETIVRCQGYQVMAILDSHLHVDHDSCRAQLMESLADQLAPSARTTDPLGWPHPEGAVTVGAGKSAPFFRLGQEDIVARVELPGHTTVGCVYLLGTPHDGALPAGSVRFAFSGDTILIGGIGRTDFHTSSTDALYESILRLSKLVGPATVLCPTHDYNNSFATTLETERRENPFLGRILDPVVPMTLEEFRREKPLLDAGIDDESNAELVCGNIAPPTRFAASLDIAPEDRREFFGQHRDALVIDVREPQEFRFVRDWKALGLAETPLNVPLTRLAGFLQDLFSSHPDRADLEVICLCRSGNRSGRVAEVLRRNGVGHAWNIAGGLALGEQGRVASPDSEYAI